MYIFFTKFDLRVIVQGVIISVRRLLGVSVRGYVPGREWGVLSAISSIGIHEISAS